MTIQTNHLNLSGSQGKRPSKREIPTVAQAVDLFLAHNRHNKSLKDHVSILRGAAGRRHGKDPAGPALAQSRVGQTPLYRLTSHDLDEWFDERHPQWLAASTKKRGMSSLTMFLRYCRAHGWIDETVMHAHRSLPASPPRRDWLHPEQVEAITALMQSGDEFDAYDRFAWALALATGARASELPRILARDYSPRTRHIHISAGKGRGDGKPRDIPVDQAFGDLVIDHIARNGLAPNQPLLFHRRVVLRGGARREVELTADKRLSTSPQTIRRLMARVRAVVVAKAQAGHFPPELVPEFALVPTVARRTFACNQLIAAKLGQGGMEAVQLQKAMGHESFDTTKVYLADIHLYLGDVTEHVNTIEAARRIAEWKRRRHDNGGASPMRGGSPMNG